MCKLIAIFKLSVSCHWKSYFPVISVTQIKNSWRLHGFSAHSCKWVITSLYIHSFERQCICSNMKMALNHLTCSILKIVCNSGVSVYLKHKTWELIFLLQLMIYYFLKSLLLKCVGFLFCWLFLFIFLKKIILKYLWERQRMIFNSSLKFKKNK